MMGRTQESRRLLSEGILTFCLTYTIFRPQPLDSMTSQDAILRLLIRSVQDKGATIRARALQVIQPLLEDFDICIRFSEITEKIVSILLNTNK
jgi:hypothetical protein